MTADDTDLGVGDISDAPPADGLVGDDMNADLESDFDFQDTWATVDESDSGVSGDGYPVLRALDCETRVEARA